MGVVLSLFSSGPTDQQDVPPETLRTLLEAPNGPDWDLVLARLNHSPEEAAAFCHSVEPSPLALAVSRRNPPPPAEVVRTLLDSYDEAAYYPDEDGNTALHCSIVDSMTDDDTTSSNADMILEANPEAASVPNRSSGRIPLHYAASVQLASRLIREFPGGLGKRDRMGRIPLHWAVDPDGKRGGVSPDLVRLLVEEGKKRGVGVCSRDDTNSIESGADGNSNSKGSGNGIGSSKISSSSTGEGRGRCGGVLLKDSSGKTPLDLLCHRITETFRRDETTGRLLPLCIEGERQWDALTAMVVHGAVPQSEEQFRMVHKVVELGLPPPVVSHALRTYPNHATERDSLGRTPLMIAASSIRRSDSHEVVSALLNDPDHGHPEAARIIDGEGRLPIDAAGEMGHDEKVLGALARAEPRAVDTRDLRDKFFPFMTAAIGERSDLTSVYHLLRETPHVLTHFLEE